MNYSLANIPWSVTLLLLNMLKHQGSNRVRGRQRGESYKRIKLIIHAQICHPDCISVTEFVKVSGQQ